jgi:adenylate cyclase
MKMMRQLDKLSERAKRPIAMGIGVHGGEVIAGNLGSEDKIDYAITGDTVNTGKRIEMLTKSDPNKILISDSVYKKVHHLVKVNRWEPVYVKGKRDPLTVYEVISALDLATARS